MKYILKFIFQMKTSAKKITALLMASMVFSFIFSNEIFAQEKKDTTKVIEVKPPDPKTPPDFKPKVGGYVEGWFRYDESDLTNYTATADNAKRLTNEFRIRRARIDVKGNLTAKLGYRVNAALDHSAPGASYSVKLWDGYLVYNLHPLLMITVGQFKYHFTLEGLEGTPDRIPILRAEGINEIASKIGTKGGSFRDNGILLNGEKKGKKMSLKYGLAVINGTGINQGDNNNDKDIVGRVVFSPLKGLSCGGSYYIGTAQDLVRDKAASKKYLDTIVYESAYGIEADFILKGISLRGEYVAGEWKNWNVSKSRVAKDTIQNPNGWYFQAAYRLPKYIPNLQVMARYEDYERDKNTAGSHLKTTTVGLTYYLKGKTRISANYLLRDSGTSSIIGAQESSAKNTDADTKKKIEQVTRIGNLFLLQFITTF